MKLKPEFKPEKVKERRKNHPIFHDELVPKSSRVKVNRIEINC